MTLGDLRGFSAADLGRAKKFHWRSEQGIKFFTAEKATELAGTNPDYAQQDLFEAIDQGNFPSWTLCVQTMTVAQAEEFKYNILDLTKIWSHGQFPLRPIGKLTLNANVQNYFGEGFPIRSSISLNLELIFLLPLR